MQRLIASESASPSAVHAHVAGSHAELESTAGLESNGQKPAKVCCMARCMGYKHPRCGASGVFEAVLTAGLESNLSHPARVAVWYRARGRPQPKSLHKAVQEDFTPSNQDRGVFKSWHHCVQAPHGFELVEHWLSELDLPSEVGSSGSQPVLPPSSGLADPGSHTEDERSASGRGHSPTTLPIQAGPCPAMWALPAASWGCLHSQVWLALAARSWMTVSHLLGTACLASHCPTHGAPPLSWAPVSVVD